MAASLPAFWDPPGRVPPAPGIPPRRRRHAGSAGNRQIERRRGHDHPRTRDSPATRVTAAALGQRIAVLTGDAMADELPAGYDVFLLANLIHYWSPDQNQALLQRLRQTTQPGAALLLADFWTNPAHTEPLQAALMAGEFAVHLRTGDVYSVEEVRTWLNHTGWRFTDHRPLAGPQSLIVAEAV